MRRIAGLVAIGAVLAGVLAGQGRGPRWRGGQPAIASAPAVELKGRVARVLFAPGEGMPSLEVKTGAGIAKLQLGSLRYLMAQGFNPKVDEEIVAKAYKLENGYVAIRVSLPARNKTVQLRDGKGWPLWSGRGRFTREP